MSSVFYSTKSSLLLYKAHLHGSCTFPALSVMGRFRANVRLSNFSFKVSKEMASQALMRIYRNGGWNDELTNSISEGLQMTKAAVTDRILTKTLGVTDSKNIDQHISKQQKLPTDVELSIKEARLKEAMRRKMELETKLEAVKETLNEFSEEVPRETQAKVSLQDSKLRKQYMTEEQQKAQEAKEFARKLREAQIDRERRKQLKGKEMHQKIQMEIEGFEEQKRLRTEEEEYKKQQRLADMRAKAEARQERSEQLRKAEQDYRKLVQEKLITKKLDEVFLFDRMMPELERRKEELAKKRQGFKPINREELEEHARHVDEMRREHELKRLREKSARQLDEQAALSQRHLASKFTYSVIHQDTEAKAALEREQLEKKRLAEKKRKYAEIVKEMFTPTIDSLKQKEMQLMQERLKNPVKSFAKRSQSSVPREDSRSQVHSSLDKDLSNSPKLSHRKFKKNTMIPDKKPKPQPMHVDYLGERRKYRETYALGDVNVRETDWSDVHDESMDPEVKALLLKRKVQRVEKEAKRQELLLSSINPSDINGLEAVDKVNDMLIGSIKAKLSMLDQVRN